MKLNMKTALEEAQQCRTDAFRSKTALDPQNQWILDTFEVDQPCSMEPPAWRVRADGDPEVTVENGITVPTSEARAWAKMILLACDEADAAAAPSEDTDEIEWRETWSNTDDPYDPDDSDDSDED